MNVNDTTVLVGTIALVWSKKRLAPCQNLNFLQHSYIQAKCPADERVLKENRLCQSCFEPVIVIVNWGTASIQISRDFDNTVSTKCYHLPRHMALWQSWQSSSFRRFRNFRAHRSAQRLLCSCAGHVRRVWGSRVDAWSVLSCCTNLGLRI